MDTNYSAFQLRRRKASSSTGFVSKPASGKGGSNAEEKKGASGGSGGSGKKPPRRWKKPLLIAGCVAAALAIGVIVYTYVLLSQVKYVSLDESARIAAEQQMQAPEVIEDVAEEDISSEVSVSEVVQTQLTQEELDAIAQQEKLSNVTNILLIGVDRRGGSNVGNTDTIMIASLDRNNKRVKLTSLMRDMFLPIPDVGEGRINSAASKGGLGKLMETIQLNFMLSIDKYVLVDFRMFEKIVDNLGGVTMTLSAGEVSAANDCIAGLNKQRGLEDFRKGFIMRSGEIKLTGLQALGYARIRHYNGGDYARTNRQFKVLKMIFTKFLNKDLVSQQQMLFDLLPMVETNLSELEIVDLALAALQMNTDEMLHYRLPAEGFYQSRSIRGMSVLVPDIPANAKALHDFIYDALEQPDLPEMKIRDKGGAYVPPDYDALPEETEDPLQPTPPPAEQPPAEQPPASTPTEPPQVLPMPEATPTASAFMPVP